MDARHRLGFTLIEIAVTIAIIAMLIAAGGTWMLSMHPGALRSGVHDFDASMDAARSLAATSGIGATVAFTPRTNGGFAMRVYSGRPNADGAVHPTNVAIVVSDASVSERTLGTPPFAIFISSAGHVTGIAQYPQVDANGIATFGVIAQQPPCPVGGLTFTFTSPQRNASVSRTIPCSATVTGGAVANPSPTPNAPLITPKSLLAHWTQDAAALKFVATEWGYTHWFASATGMQCGTIASYPSGSPYSQPYNNAEAAAAPAPPSATAYSFPNSNGQSMNDAPASFALSPIKGSPGFCTVDIVDAFGQHATSAVQIMGDMTPSSPSLTFKTPNDPPQTVTLSKSYDSDALQLRFGGNCGQVITYAPPIVTTHTPPSPSPSDVASVTISIQPNGSMAAHCQLLVSDQYGEPSTTIDITIGHPQLRTWPNAVKYAPSGQTFLASVDTLHDPIAWVNRVLGGATAFAASQCKAQAFTDGTYSTPDATPPANVAGLLASEGISIDARGCYMAGGALAVAPLVVWEPDGSTQTYHPLTNCGALVNSGVWHPSVTAQIASLDTAGGSGSGVCSINLDDGSGATLSEGHGIVAAQVITNAIFASTNATVQNIDCVSAGNNKWTCLNGGQTNTVTYYQSTDNGTTWTNFASTPATVSYSCTNSGGQQTWSPSTPTNAATMNGTCTYSTNKQYFP